ncbi:MAG: lysophospholipid acyltransferase family protein [Isosphaeraceae bacterium]
MTLRFRERNIGVGMKIEHPLLIRAVGCTGAWLVRRLGNTIDYHFRYEDSSVNPEVARRLDQRYIYAFFHEVMLFPAYYWAWPEMHILISDHRDGELITQVIKRLGFGIVRGSTSRGGARALREMTSKIDRGNLCVTPDGPRGPRRHVHQGLVYLASRTGLPIVGAGMAFKNPWRAASWDRFCVPRPHSKAACVAPAPVTVPPDADRETLEACRALVERRMQTATDEAEAWVEQL